MKKSLATLSLVLASFASAGTYTLHQGWNLFGARENIDIQALRNSAIKIVWTFDNREKRWSAYSPEPAMMDLIRGNRDIAELSSVEAGSGFWVYAESEGVIDTSIVEQTPTENMNGAIRDLIGRELYQNCNGEIVSINLKSDGELIVTEGAASENVPYSIEGNMVITYQDDGASYHLLIEYTNQYVKFFDSSDPNNFNENDYSIFYFTQEDALQNPRYCDGGDEVNEVPYIIEGRVRLIDENNESVAIPDNAWIRVTPTRFQIEGEWYGINCKVNSDGTFGNECYIPIDEALMREALDDPNERYQVVVYAETNENKRWERDERAYAFGRGDLPLSALQDLILFYIAE